MAWTVPKKQKTSSATICEHYPEKLKKKIFINFPSLRRRSPGMWFNMNRFSVWKNKIFFSVFWTFSFSISNFLNFSIKINFLWNSEPKDLQMRCLKKNSWKAKFSIRRFRISRKVGYRWPKIEISKWTKKVRNAEKNFSCEKKQNFFQYCCR